MISYSKSSSVDFKNITIQCEVVPGESQKARLFDAGSGLVDNLFVVPLCIFSLRKSTANAIEKSEKSLLPTNVRWGSDGTSSGLSLFGVPNPRKRDAITNKQLNFSLGWRTARPEHVSIVSSWHWTTGLGSRLHQTADLRMAWPPARGRGSGRRPCPARGASCSPPQICLLGGRLFQLLAGLSSGVGCCE